MTCQMLEDGFKTAKKQNPRQAAATWTRAPREGPASTPWRAICDESSADCPPKTPMSAIAFRRRRDLLVRSIVDEFNTTVFGGALPADLEIVWSNFFSKTAGLTKFRMLQLSDGEEERFGGQAAERHAGAADRSKGARERQETELEEADILTASVELSSKIVDSEERLRCTLVLNSAMSRSGW